jgi:glutaredoxin 3
MNAGRIAKRRESVQSVTILANPRHKNGKVLSSAALTINRKDGLMATKVTVYGTATCPWCTKAKQYLEGKGVQFEYVDVGADRARAQDMMRKSGQMGVPVVEIGEKLIVGFDREAIDGALGL